MLNRERNKKIPIPILMWFVLDAIVALAPPLYWLVDDNRMMLILGAPASLVYFLAVALCITLSLVTAYVVEAKQGAFQ